MAQLGLGERILLTLAGAAGFFGLWHGVAVSGLVAANALPTPGAVLTTAWRLCFEPFAGHTLPEHLLASLGRFGMGFGLAALVGVPLGLAMGRWRLLDDIVSPIFEMLRFVAPLAWVPFAALWFGTGIGGPVLGIFAGALPPRLPPPLPPHCGKEKKGPGGGPSLWRSISPEP